MELNLRDSIKIMNKIIQNNPDVEVYLESFPRPHFVIQSKIIEIGG